MKNNFILYLFGCVFLVLSTLSIACVETNKQKENLQEDYSVKELILGDFNSDGVVDKASIITNLSIERLKG